jgi:hypothetical protein
MPLACPCKRIGWHSKTELIPNGHQDGFINSVFVCVGKIAISSVTNADLYHQEKQGLLPGEADKLLRINLFILVG